MLVNRQLFLVVDMRFAWILQLAILLGITLLSVFAGENFFGLW